MQHAAFGIGLVAQQKKHRGALAQGVRKTAGPDLAIHDALQNHPLRLIARQGKFEAEILWVDGPEAGLGKQVQPAQIAPADVQNAFDTVLLVQVAAEVLQRGEERGQFALGSELVQFLQAGPQKIRIDGVKVFAHGRPGGRFSERPLRRRGFASSTASTILVSVSSSRPSRDHALSSSGGMNCSPDDPMPMALTR